MLKSLHTLGSFAENFLLIQISSILSVIFTRLWLPESVLISQLHFSKACWELWLSEDQPHSDYNGQWQMALCILAVLQSSQPNPQRNEKKNRKMYAIKQIKICAEYRDMLPRPRLDLSGTPGLRPIGLSPGSWQTNLGLGSMSRYSAQILICIIRYPDSKVHGANMGPNWDRQDPGGPYVGPMNLAIWVLVSCWANIGTN